MAASPTQRFRVDLDATMSSISRTWELPDGYHVFGTFAEAKAVLLAFLRGQRSQYAEAARDAIHLCADDVS